MAVVNKHAELKTKHAIARENRTDEQIYIEIATANDPGQYATMGTTTVTNNGSSIGDSTGIQNLQVDDVKKADLSLGMTLPDVRESNKGWYVTKDGRVFNANGYIYDGKTYFTSSIYQNGELPSSDNDQKTNAEKIKEAIENGSNVVEGATGTGGSTGGETASTTEYTVTFNTDGGSSVPSQTITSGSTATRPETDPSKSGYTFAGWYADEAKTTEFSFTTPITGNTTIYAKWKEEATTYSVNEEVTVAGEPFIVLKDDGGTTVTLLAKYKVNTSTNKQSSSATDVAFDSTMPYSNNYDESTIKPLVEAYATSLGVEATGRLLTREEVIAVCQAVKPAYDGDRGTPFPTESDGTPKWLRDVNWWWLGSPVSGYSIEYWSLFGTDSYLINSNVNNTLGLRPVITVSKDVVEATGTGGSTGGITGGETPSTTEYTVTFNTDGGSTVASQTVESGSTATKPADPSKSGYKFAGWYANENKTTEFSFTTPITGNTTIYAKWYEGGVTFSKVRTGTLAVGDEVEDSQGERYFVVSIGTNDIRLLTKYNLNLAGTAQENAKYATTGCAFSTKNYWNGKVTSKNVGAMIVYDLTSSDAVDNEGGAATAFDKARAYGIAKGGTGTLMTVEEMYERFGARTGSNSIPNWLAGKNYGAGDKTDGYLVWWLGSATGSSGGYIWFVYGQDSSFAHNNYNFTGGIGVRPVITVSRSLFSN